MAVDPSNSAGQFTDGGITYHFCSLGCAGKFAANPGLYAKGKPDSTHS
jgi:Cu+-exporting ATPase